MWPSLTDGSRIFIKMHLNVEMGRHRERLRERIRALELGGVLFFDMVNIRYLTGFTGEEGFFVMTGKEGFLLVDGRFTTQAKEEVAEDVQVELLRDSIADAAKFILGHRISPLGLEVEAISQANFTRLRRLLKGVKIRGVKGLVEPLRAIKDEGELSFIKKAARVAEAALEEVIPMIRPGVSEREIAWELDYRIKRRGAEGVAFPTIVVSGPRAALPHGRPSERRLKRGEVVIVDFGAVWNGYHSDETCTFLLGKNEEAIRAYRVVQEAKNRAYEEVRAGVKGDYVDRVARKVITQAGYGAFFSHGTGHGVGLRVHEMPRLGPRSRDVLMEGMVVTVEPGVYLPGKWGIRLEDMVLVKEKGGFLITGRSKELMILD